MRMMFCPSCCLGAERTSRNGSRRCMKPFSQVLEAVLKNYKPSLFVEAEFPNSDLYRKGRYAGHDPSFPHIMHNLLADIMARAQAINSGDANLTIEPYVELVTISLILLYSRLLRWLCDPANRVHRAWKPQAEKLNRRLTKACRYYQGINNLTRLHFFSTMTTWG
ncbi:hypothetical protein EDC04DRAFT_2754406 [Pisolithus marmoratus]|nr:hypothetical protein EDC04DRAFT_2754406 [Pisolithus marmoratus]